MRQHRLLILVLTLGITSVVQADVSVVTGPRPHPLEKYAATQLASYLWQLHRLPIVPVTRSTVSSRRFLVGSPQTNPAVKSAMGNTAWPQLSPQGFLIRPTKQGVVIGGGSPRATMWAVYELVERWGVRFFMDGDVLPVWAGTKEEVKIPRQPIRLEPKLRIRQWRVVNDFACGPESWGIKHYRPLIDQLAKLKFNRLHVSLYPWQPFLDLKHDGVKRKRAWLWYNFHYPITADMPARHLFGDRKEFWNPDLPIKASYSEFAKAGKKHLRSLLQHAKNRGFEIGMTANIGEFPQEFAKSLKDHRKIYASLGNLTINPGPKQPMDDPKLLSLSAAVMQQTLNEFPEVDFLLPQMPEISSWTDEYEKAWKILDRKYGIGKRFSLEQLLTAGKNRRGYAAGAERAVIEVKCNICALYVIDKLLTDQHALKNTKRPDAFISFKSMAEEVLPLLQYVLPKRSETLNLLDYTPERIVARPDAFKLDPRDRMQHALIFTLHDDNVGVLPQLNTTSLSTLSNHLRKNRWAGFTTRYWMISDHEPCMAFLARRCWNDGVSVEGSYRDHIKAVCGAAAIPDMLAGFGHLEKVTRHLNGHGLGLTFPIPGMIRKHFRPGPLSKNLAQDRAGYRRALAAFQRAHRRAERGRDYTHYWVKRLQFGIGYINCIEAAHRLTDAKLALQNAQQAGQSVGQSRQAAIAQAMSAVKMARDMLETLGDVARNQSDRGAIAVMVEYVYRPFKAELARLQRR